MKKLTPSAEESLATLAERTFCDMSTVGWALDYYLGLLKDLGYLRPVAESLESIDAGIARIAAALEKLVDAQADQSQSTDSATTLWRRLAEAGTDGLTRTEISAVFHRHKTRTEIDAMLHHPVLRGRIRREVAIVDSKRIETWYVQPNADGDQLAEFLS